MKKLLSMLMASTMIIGTVNITDPIFAFDAPEMDFSEERNYAMDGIPSAYNSPIDYWGPDKLIDGIINRDADKPEQSRWSSEVGAPGWVKIDLKEERTFKKFLCAFENEKVRKFHIDISNDDKEYTTIFTSEDKKDGNPMDSEVELDEEVTARYVKLTIDSLIDGAYPSVSMYEFEILGNEEYKDLAPESTAEANHVEAGTQFTADKTIDKSFDKNSRWSSDYTEGSNILTYTFKEPKKIASLILEWERLNATKYHIEVLDNGQWVNVKDLSLAANFSERINLDEPVVTTGIRVVIDDFFSEAENRDGELIDYPTVSLYEVGIYDKPLYIAPVDEVTAADVANELTVEPVGTEDTKLKMPEVPEGFEISFVGADYEQIVAHDMTIKKPLTDQKVVVNFEVSRKTTDDDGNEVVDKATSPAITVMIPGLHDAAESVNDKPEVLPELQQWYGYEGEFTIKDSSRIVVDPSAAGFMEVANTFAKDYKDILGKYIEVVSGSNPQTGDFYFTLSDERLDKETYVMNVEDYVTVEASESTGAYWSTRTILQILKQTNATIAKGITKDYPKYEVRGFMLDVARRPFQMDFLEDLVKTMSWYKLNNFHVHLNDNCFGKLEDGKTPDYSGFRLESDIPNLTSTDYYYTKDEFRSFIKNSKKVGVDIVPEFDSPGHSGAFVRARPDLARADSNEYLDVENPESLEFIKSVFAEYMTGEDPVFPKGTVVHVGTDEYKRGNKEAFRKYQDELLKYVRDDLGYTPRVWGSQTENNGTTPITVDGVQMDLWYTGYANPREMYEKGYQCINKNDGDLYIVPGAGYYYDYLNQGHIYGDWQPNKIGNFTIPVGSDQMLGSTFSVWNDKTGPSNDNGTSDVEVFDRIFAITPTFASKLWGDIEDYSLNELNSLTEEVKYAPNSNPTYEVDSISPTVMKYNFDSDKGLDRSGNNYNLTEQKNIAYNEGKHNEALTLKGDSSYVETPVEDLGINSTLEFWVKRDANSTDEEQVLFESENGAIKAVQKDTGKFGFSREWHDYSFNYELPKGEWVKIKLDTSFTTTKLYVNDELVDTLGINATGKKWASLVLPLEKIGSENKAFEGQIDDVVVKKKVTKQENCVVTATSEEPSDAASHAIDGNPNTMWHTKWDGSDKLPQSITLEYPEAIEIDGYNYLPRQSGTNGIITKYTIEVSENGKEFTTVAEGDWTNDATEKHVTFSPCMAKYIRLTALEGNGGFASAAEISVHKTAADKSELSSLISVAERMKEDDFTADSWKAFANVLSDAKAVYENSKATQDEVNKACIALEAALDSLVDKGDDAVEQAKAILKTTIDKAEVIMNGEDFNQVIEIVRNLITTRYNEALAVYEDKNATLDQVIEAWNNLADALQYADFKADKSDLKELIDKANTTEWDNYTESTVKAAKEALANAVKVYEDVNALQDKVNAAWEDLNNALNTLTEKPMSDKTFLKAVIDKAKTAIDNEKNYVHNEAWKAFVEAYKQALNVYNEKYATSQDVQKATSNLTAAYENIRLVPSEELLSQLKDFINIASDIDRNAYSKEDLAYIDSVRKEAESMLSNKDFSEKEFNEFAKKMNKVLQVIQDNKLPDTSDDSVTADDSNDSVKTGVTSNVATLGGMLLLAGGVFAALSKKRREDE